MKSFNYWPVIVALIFITVITAIVYTLLLVSKDPLEYDTYFEQDYDYVKRNFIQLQIDSENFDKKYDFVILSELSEGENILRVALFDSNGKFISNARIKALLTRPATNRYNIPLNRLKLENKAYVSSPFSLETKGIWNLEFMIRLDSLQVYRSFKYQFTDPKKDHG